MEIQIQGQFKRLPQGEIYMGAYVSNKMELGLITRSIAKAALSYVGSRVTNMHYSFGDSDPNDPAFQLPHCVSPMFVTFDKIIVTPPGETPPKIRDPYDEDPEYRKMRLNWHRIKDANIQLDNIYSFSSNTQNIDLVTWTLTNFPMIRALDIRTLAGESSLFLAAYELPTAAAQAFPNSHPQKDLNYVFSMRLNPVSADKMIDLTSEGKEVKARPIELDDDLADGEEDNDEDRDGDQTSKHHGDLANMNAMSRESRIVSDDEGDEYEMVNEAGDDDDDEEDDEVDSKKLVSINSIISLAFWY